MSALRDVQETKASAAAYESSFIHTRNKDLIALVNGDVYGGCNIMTEPAADFLSVSLIVAMASASALQVKQQREEVYT